MPDIADEQMEDCPDCGGAGGHDASRNCEEYDDWRACPTCDGTGKVPMGFDKGDVFVPERDALTPND